MPTITYIGHSAFTLDHDGKQVLIDPFITGNPAATMKASDFAPQTILITHAHNDHVGDAVALAKRTGGRIITTVELADYLETEGLEQVTGANFGGTVAFDGGSVKLVPAWHSSTYMTKEGFQAPGIPSGLVVRFGGKAIYFAGDTCLFGDMQLIGDEGLDVAVLPIGDHYTMGPSDAVRAAEFLRAKRVIPCHFNTFPLLKQDGAAFKQAVESKTGAVCSVMAPGDRLELE